MPSDRQAIAPDVRQRWKQGRAMLAAGCAIVMMVCVLGGVVVQWRGQD
jgi:hypothetical protein